MAHKENHTPNIHTTDGPMVIDIGSILRKRFPRAGSGIAGGMVARLIARIIHQDGLNEILKMAYPSRGSDFCNKVLDYLSVRVEVEGLDKLPSGQKFVFASNHPLGGLDGIALIAVLGKKYGDEGIRFIVNDMLMNVEPLQDVFLPVNKFGSQGKSGVSAIREAHSSDCHILQFPAGLVSRLNSEGEVKDLEWQKAFVAKAIEYGRDIVPVRFEALNTKRFYKLAKLRKKLGIKFNFEQILLPSEVFKSRGKHFRIVFGTPISWKSLKEKGGNYREIAREIREKVYDL